MPSPESIPGWDAFVDALRELPGQMLAKLPEHWRGDPQIQQEVGRLALSALTSTAIDTLGGDGDHPEFLPQLNNVLTTGQPNSDTSYRSARLTPGGTYRLRGKLGSTRMVRIAQSGPPAQATPGAPPNLGAPRPVLDVNALSVDKNGHIDVIMSPTRPKGHTGDWWELQPTSNRLLLRMVSSDWAGEVMPTLSIERVDAPVTRPRPSAAVLEQRLRALPQSVAFIGLLLVDHVEQLRQGGHINSFKIFDLSNLGGLAGQFYYEGAYELADDEALLVEATVPKKYRYYSLILTNDIYETTDWYNNHSSLNDAQAQVDPDGVLRIIVSARDPGVPNWLDTAGYRTGVMQGRWTECDNNPIPHVRKLSLSEVRDALPAGTPVVTPEQRDRQLRDRRSALQQRSLW